MSRFTGKIDMGLLDSFLLDGPAPRIGLDAQFYQRDILFGSWNTPNSTTYSTNFSMEQDGIINGCGGFGGNNTRDGNMALTIDGLQVDYVSWSGSPGNEHVKGAREVEKGTRSASVYFNFTSSSDPANLTLYAFLSAIEKVRR